jgi:hypothetical protein
MRVMRAASAGRSWASELSRRLDLLLVCSTSPYTMFSRFYHESVMCNSDDEFEILCGDDEPFVLSYKNIVDVSRM